MLDGARGRGSRLAATALVVVASLAILLAVAVGYVRRAAVDSDQFANRATAALKDDNVRSLVAERITDQLILEHKSDLIAARPIIQSVVSPMVGGRAFTGVFRAGVRDVHRAVFDRDRHTLTLTVADIGTLVAAGLEVVRPALAREVESTRRVAVVRRDIGAVAADAAGVADKVRLLGPLLALVAVLAAACALALSGDRRRTVVQLGVGAAVAGVVLVVGLGIARSAVSGGAEEPEVAAAIGGIWNAFLGDLHTAGWILAGSGAVIAAAAASLIRPIDIDEPLRRLGRWITTEPVRPAAKALRAAVLVAAGLLFILDRDAVLRLLFTGVGLYLVYAGVSAFLWLIYQPRSERAERRPARPARGRARAAVAALVAAVLVVGGVGAFVGSGGTSVAAPAAGPCNGHVELCARPLDEVALVATHNSMSAPLPGWYSSAQDSGIADQLREGVRGLLIDTHYADRLENGRLRTFVGEPEELRQNAARDGVSPRAVDSALRLRERLGFAGEGERDMYLCHSFCELGGTLLSEALDEIHDFLVANPGEVLVIVNQDYVTPRDFVEAVEQAELADMAYRGPTGERWLTLRQMIDRNQRVVFLAENEAGAAPWYRLAYERITEETPYSFSRPRQLTDPARVTDTCRPNRGPEGAPLLLINHWVTTDPVPLPSHADLVNAYEPLLRRVRECGRIRDHVPNLVGVNFYRRGDVARVVDELNGVD